MRCESCGAKAILAASRCPKCTHSLDLRDHHGELVPLAYCRKCETSYPLSRGGCKWCGTKPSTTRVAPIVGAAVALTLVAGLGWWFLRSRGDVEPPVVTQQMAPPPAAPVVVPEPVTLPAADTGPPPIDSSAVLRAGDSIPPLPGPATPAVLPPSPRQDTVTFVKFARARVVEFVNVRAAPTPRAPVLAVLAPGVRLDIGGRQSGWRLIRADGVTGWADPRNFRVDSGPPR